MIAVGVAMLAVPVAIAGYAYFLYPLLLRAIPQVRVASGAADATSDWPPITITLAAYNEERAIGDTLRCLLDTDYPADRRQIVVVSDASTDRTDDIVRGFADRGVELIRLPRRSGKTAAENASRERIRGDIVVNVDASVRVPPAALKPLVAAFGDKTVGVASGRDVSVKPSTRTQNVGEAGYVGYEMWVRDLETRAGGIVGASGCFYASRRQLQGVIVPEALSRDFAAPLIAREHGYRTVSVREAICFVPSTESLRSEYRRKVRTMARGLDTLFHKRRLLNPLRHGRFAWMLLSHKLARWLVPWSILVGLAGAVVLAFAVPWIAWGLAVATLGAALVGVLAWWWPAGATMPSLLSGLGYLGFGLLAGLHAWVKAIRLERSAVWEPTRR